MQQSVTVHHYLGAQNTPQDPAQASVSLAAAQRLIASLNAPGREAKWYNGDKLVEPSAVLTLQASYEYAPPPSISNPKIASWLRKNSSIPPPLAGAVSSLGVFEHSACFHATRARDIATAKRGSLGERIEGQPAKKRKTVSFSEAPEDQTDVSMLSVVKRAPSTEATAPARRSSSSRTKTGGRTTLEPQNHLARRSSPTLAIERDAGRAKSRENVVKSSHQPYPLTSTPAIVPELQVEPPSFELYPSVGAIQRCIPPPYRHLTHLDADMNPERQHIAPILHSYVDPAASSPKYPVAQSYLLPGLRGAWLVPVSGPFSYLKCTPPSWDLALSPSPPPLSSTTQTTIQWTDARLSSLWNMITRVRESRRMGSILATTFVSDDRTSPIPDHVKINCDAHLALAIRSLLRLVKAAPKESSSGSDTVQFLKKARLVWVDTMGKPILLA